MIVFAWEQLPVYAARAIGRFVGQCDDEVVVVRVAFKRFDIKGAEAQTGCRVVEADRNDLRSIAQVVGKIPDVMLVGGWASPCFTRWVREVRRNGGKTILTTDEAYVDSGLKQTIRKLRFMAMRNRLYDKIFYCGAGGWRQFHDYYGISGDRLFGGVYGSDPALFRNGPPLKDRAKRFLFVGHFDANKNVLPMCEAFLRVHDLHPDWELELCGSGELEPQIPRKPGILLTGFVQAENLGEKYRAARCLVLGSFSEKWGVVVHEAAASGCMLAMSRNVGSNPDFVRPENAVVFDPSSVEDMMRALLDVVKMDDEGLARAQEVSVQLAQNFSPDVFARNLKKALADFKGNQS